MAKELGSYAQVSDIDEGFSAGKTRLDFRIRPEGRSLGLTSQDVARQIRAAFSEPRPCVSSAAATK